jgi:hypothetical protein
MEQQQPKAETSDPIRLDLSVARGGAAIPAVPLDLPETFDPTPPSPARAGRWGRLAGRLAGWTRRRMPWRKELPFQSAAVQTELALDKVKVMRNDLSEDDLEVVAINKRTVKKLEKPVQSEELEKLTANP